MKTNLLIIVILSLAISSFAQKKGKEKVDSLQDVLKTATRDSTRINALNALAFIYKSNDPDTALYYAGKALELATKTNDRIGMVNAYLYSGVAQTNLGKYDDALKANTEALNICDDLLKTNLAGDTDTKNKILKLKASAYNNIGNTYDNQGAYQEALKNDNAALQISQEIDDKAGIAASYNNIGNIFAAQGIYPEALKNMIAALKIKEQLGDKKSIANSYNNIGIIYWNQGDFKEALKNYFAALKIRETIGDKFGIASSYNNIGLVYEDQGNRAEALKYHFDALKIEEEISDKKGIAISYDNIGNIYLYQRNYPEALNNFLASLKISEEIEDKDGIASSFIHIGEAYANLQQPSLASAYLNNGLSLAKEIGSIDYIKDAYEGLAKSDSIKGDFNNALRHYKLYISYRDSIFNDNNTKKLVQSQMQYEFDKKEAAARFEQEKKDAETEREKNIQYLTIAMLAILVLAIVIITLILWRNNKHKQAANILLSAQKTTLESTLSELQSTQAQLIQSEKMASMVELTAGIAHEIQNPLNFVNNFSDLSQELLDEMRMELLNDNKEAAFAIADDVKQNLEKINHHGNRADSIVKSMLEHSRMSTGQKKLTNINDLANEYLRLSYKGLRARDKSFHALLQTDFDPAVTELHIISQDIGRVLLNLYNNAFYAVAERNKSGVEGYQPTVSVTTKFSKLSSGVSAVSISVKDNGNGIAQKILDKIFQPFFTTKPTGLGTGPGLSLSYDIIKAHNGELKVETEEGEYTEFLILLPVV